MKRPTPDELAKLRELYPQGAPRIDYREMTLVRDDGAESADANGLIPISISSESPVLRYDWWSSADDPRYYEVLDHSKGSVILDYARDGMPFVASHRSWDADQQHGLVENVRVEKNVLRGDVRMSRAQRSQEIAQDMRDGIRKKISVGYIVGDQYDQTEKAADGIPIRRYTAWMPLEASTVPIPADYTVGVGRALSPEGQYAIARFLQLVPAVRAATPAVPAVPPTPAAPKAEERTMPDELAAPAAPITSNVAPTSGTSVVNVGVDHSAARNAETQRISNIRSMGTQGAIDSEKIAKWIGAGTSELEVTREINTILTERMAKPIQTVQPLDISPKDAKRFSFARAIMTNTELESEFRMGHPGGAKVDFGFEREMLQEVSRGGGAQKGGSMLPLALLGRAGIDSSVSTTGGPFKFTEHGAFIPLLRNRTSVLRAGSTLITGLTGPITFPKQSSTAGVVWSAENPGSDISFTNLLTTTVSLQFKSIAAGTAFSRQMLFSAASGNYSIDQIVQDDLTAAIGIGIDLAGLNGLGSSNQPKGVLKNTSIGQVTIGANGGAMTWNQWVDLETKIGQANANTSRMAYIASSKQRGTAKKTAVLGNTASGVPIWTGPSGEEQFDGQVNGYRAIASEQVPDNLTKGTSTTVCSAIVFGAWEHNLIGMFGPGFEAIVDPYGKKFQGMVEVAVWSYVDVAQRYDGAFAVVPDAT